MPLSLVHRNGRFRSFDARLSPSLVIFQHSRHIASHLPTLPPPSAPAAQPAAGAPAHQAASADQQAAPQHVQHGHVHCQSQQTPLWLLLPEGEAWRHEQQPPRLVLVATQARLARTALSLWLWASVCSSLPLWCLQSGYLWSGRHWEQLALPVCGLLQPREEPCQLVVPEARLALPSPSRWSIRRHPDAAPDRQQQCVATQRWQHAHRAAEVPHGEYCVQMEQKEQTHETEETMETRARGVTPRKALAVAVGSWLHRAALCCSLPAPASLLSAVREQAAAGQGLHWPRL